MNVGLFLIILSFKAGFVPSGSYNYAISDFDIKNSYDLSNTFYLEGSIKIEIAKYFYIGGSINNMFNKKYVGIGFSPDHDKYIFNCGVRFDFIEIGYLHSCYHPLFPYLFPESSFKILAEGSIHDFYLKIDLQKRF